MPTQITPQLLEPYFRREKKNPIYEHSPNPLIEKNIIDIYNELRIHANGEYPEKVINQQRPSEPPDVQAYRKIIFQAVTKETVSRILTCLSKIRRSADWSIRFDPKTFDSSIVPEENPEAYFIENYPSFTSITNWLFSVALRNYLIDANGICAVIPLNPTPLANEYLKPFPLIFNSDQVYEYIEGDYTIIESKDKSTYLGTDGKTVYKNGKIFWVITYLYVQKWEQYNTNGDMKPTMDFVHGLGYMPAFKLGGVFMRSIDNTFIYESRIQPIVPRLNKASREDNDLDVSVVRHLFPEKWEYISVDCPKCNGIGKVVSTTDTSGFSSCDSCKGIGKIISSPFQSHLVKVGSLGDQQVPVPPAGYIVKDVDIIKVQDGRIEHHISKALAAINMEFLSQTPLNQSGTAKEVDKDELNNFVHSIAEDLVEILDRVVFISYDYRYSVRVPNKDKRKEMLPEINVPEKYDMLSVNYLLDEYTKAVSAKLSPLLISKMQEEIAQKKFSTDPDMKDELMTILRLDPFSGMTMEDKMSASSNGWVTKIDCIISANIQAFIRRAVFEDPKFYTLEIDVQKEKMLEYAEEKEAEMSAAGKVKAMGEIDLQVTAADKLNGVSKDTQGATNQDGTTSPTGSDIVGKLPLALQQLALAADRAKAQGNPKLAARIQAKMSELLPLITEDAIAGTAN